MRMIKVSVIVKAFNEEENIARAIESSLAAVAPYDGEVVVADSGSNDRTIEIASQFPVILTQLSKPTERCCGISPQLGYQHSRGEYVYILDGDMELDSAFLAVAVKYLDIEPKTAGVGGFVSEMRIANLEFESRLKRQLRRRVKHASNVDCLNGGGLYRRSAIDDVIYISDRNLHSYEEFDLGARLRAKGWTLVRLDDHAADHYGYRFNTYRLLWHRARTGYILGGGDTLRAAIACNYVTEAVLRLPGLRVALFVWLYWAAVSLGAAVAPTWLGRVAVLVVALILPVAMMTIRSKGSLETGLHSVVLWYLNAAGLLVGLLRIRHRPTKRIDSRLLKTRNDSGQPLVKNAESGE
jgi:glycosyltransferase involved in cell wall biosynthesis